MVASANTPVATTMDLTVAPASSDIFHVAPTFSSLSQDLCYQLGRISTVFISPFCSGIVLEMFAFHFSLAGNMIRFLLPPAPPICKATEREETGRNALKT